MACTVFHRPARRSIVATVCLMLTLTVLLLPAAQGQSPLDSARDAAKAAHAARAEAEKTLAERIAAEKAAMERAAAEKGAVQQAAALKATAEKELAAKVAAAKAAADKLAAEEAYHAIRDAAHAAAELAKARRTATESLAAVNQAQAQLAAVQSAAEHARAESAAAEEALSATDIDKTAAAKAVEVKKAAAKAAAEKLAAEKATAEKVAAQCRTAQTSLAEKTAACRAAQDRAARCHAEALGGLPPLASDQWNYAKARHLLVRAGFGGTPDEVQKLSEMGLHAAVDYMVNIYDRPVANIEFDPLRLERPEPWESRLEPLIEGRSLRDERIARERRQQAELRQWWLRRMAESPRPLQEKLTLFWHDHFSVQYQELYRTYMLYQQNQLFRTYGCDNYGALLRGIAHDPAMIRYLDNHRNFKNSGNENLGREILELFSMGEGHGYTEQDLREASRALTGYNYDPWTEQFVFLARRHDETDKTIFGRKGNWGGDELVTLILEQPATARYVASKLFVFLAYEDPEPEVVERLAHVLRAGNYDLRPMLKNLFLSQAFYSDRAMATHIKGPVELLVGLIRDIGLADVDYRAVDSATIQMGQMLFEPPNVAGWEENRAWITAERILTRYNLVANLVERPSADIVGLLEGRGLRTSQEVVDYLSKACLATPPSEAKRQELAAFLGELPPPDQWAAKRNQLNARLRAVVVALFSTPESQLG
ncbi:MAG: DUF1800 domain-containing protein [Planctomycetes bacterium]|nr:DUF1800 domain-containing protein [Planctomycetota bacterium]